MCRLFVPIVEGAVFMAIRTTLVVITTVAAALLLLRTFAASSGFALGFLL